MQLSLTLTIAREILFTAEKAGRLCRDEGAAGVRFYPNIFRVCAASFIQDRTESRQVFYCVMCAILKAGIYVSGA